MTIAATATEVPRWGLNTLHVRKALRWIERRGRNVTPEELVEWDMAHGNKLFPWSDAEGAARYRLHMARVFLNMFRRRFENMRVRKFIAVKPDGADARVYMDTRAISEEAPLRAQVIADITKRMESLAAELRMWKLSAAERDSLFERLARVIEGPTY